MDIINFIYTLIRKLRNYLHTCVFILYSIRNYFMRRPVWLFYTNTDLIYKSEQCKQKLF